MSVSSVYLHLMLHGPTILVSGTPRYSETFIENHIRDLNATVINLHEYLPLEHGRDYRGLYSFVSGLFQTQRKRRLLSRLNREGSRSLLIEYGTTAAMALPVLRKYEHRIVVHFHGFDVYRQKVLKHYAEAYRELFNLVHAIVVVSTDMKNRLIEIGANADKIHHIVYGIDPVAFPLCDPVKSEPVFFACGRMVEKKAPHLTILAFHKAWQKDSRLRLKIAGDGPLKSLCQDIVTSLGMDDVVKFLGQLDHQAVAHELASCRALVQHSVVASDGDSEGTPVVILEAGCSGVPVISTHHTGIAETVIDGETGILVQEHDVGAMAVAMLKLAHDSQLAGLLGQKAHKHILENYSLDASIQKLKAVLHGV